MDASHYTDQLKALLPPGPLWDGMRQPGTVGAELLAAFAEELARVDGRVADLIDETDPRTVEEMIDSWEAWVGLPDTCTGELATLAERREALHERLTATGGQSRAYFGDLAAGLGYDITITEYDPFTCETACDQPIYEEDWRFVWQVHVANASAAPVLECAFERLKPAHTHVSFTYGA